MYIRQLKQYLRNVDATFDERKFGFENLGDLMRACQRDGLLRIERDRQGGMRIFPGNLAASQPAPQPDVVQESLDGGESEAAEAVAEEWTTASSSPQESDVVDGDVVRELEIPRIVDAEEAPAPADKPARARRRREGAAPRQPRASTRKAADAPPRTRKPAKPRGRGRAQAPATKEDH
jgi:hypothetical protein